MFYCNVAGGATVREVFDSLDKDGNGTLDVSKNDEFCIKTEKLCIKNEELSIKNDEFCSVMR